MEWGPLEGLDDARPGRPWMMLESQPGFQQRAHMMCGLVRLVLALRPDVCTVTDLGCGDGSMLARLGLGKQAWGYELGGGDVTHARGAGLDVRAANILTDELTYGDLLIASEVLEHLADPVKFLERLPRGRLLIASSPSRETGTWHNAIHTWAWDLEGYRDVINRASWRVIYQVECDGGDNSFGGVTGRQCFQGVIAVPRRSS
jgi:hypothetical protein